MYMVPHPPGVECQSVHKTHKSATVVQLRVNYPSNILTVASESDCSPGTDWPANSLTFVCNARGSPSSVLMNSILQPPYRSQQGPNITVASVIFTAVDAGSGALSVDILGMAQQSGVGVSAVTPAVAAAGNVRFCVLAEVGHYLLITCR